MKLFLEFHEHGKYEKSLNGIVISHIPKKVGAVEVKDFRPTNLVSGIDKIISKGMANRLKTVWRTSFRSLKMRLSEVVRS